MRRTMSAAAAALLVVGCGAATHDSEPDRVADVYEAVLSAVVALEAPPANGEPAPVVYALPDGTEAIPAGVQVQVVKALKDDMDLRFADERVEAVDSSRDGEPVHDDGVLVTLGAVPPAGSLIEVPVDVYWTLAHHRAVVVTLTAGSTTWTVSSVAPAA
jgi:hypothetical protein